MDLHRKKKSIWQLRILSIAVTIFGLFASLSECQVVSSSSGGLVAAFNSGGLQGNIEFVPDSQGTFIRVFLRGGTYGEQLRWKIHEFSANLGEENPCSDEKIGRTFVDLTDEHGSLTAGQDVTFLSKAKLVDGRSSILGRTLVLRNPETGRLSCALIQPMSRIRTYQARMIVPIGGAVIIRQSTFGTTVQSQLWNTNGTRRDSIHRWAILQSTTGPQENYRASFQHELTRCASLQSVPFLPGGAEEISFMAVGRVPGVITGRTYHVITSAPLFDGMQNDLYVALYEDASTILACARLTPIEPRQAVAKFDSQVTGEISFRQESPFDPTLVTVNVAGLNKRGYSYGVDELPLIFRGDKSEVCPNVRGVIYNPLRKTPDAVPEPNKGSVDQYAIGDLSGKYGPLKNREKLFQQVYDLQLPLFGVRSVVGRAAVLYSTDGKPMACANIELTGRRIITAFATFDYPLQGQVIFRQDRDDPSADTSVYLELSYPSGFTTTKTYNHLWYVHERAIPTGQRFSLSGVECMQAGSHFNPYNVSIGSRYTCECSSKAPERCQVGDCSGKLGLLDIPPFGIQGSQQQIARYYFTDSNLPLVGPASIIGRAVVINTADYGEERLACANIFEHFSDYGK